ncbi:glycosyltransferase family 9 protein [Glaciimonas sp. PCH181]|uniref:glycosyltransferase family 9 protein n=1 Tax=Glaciimonas sp. PCH181 TaxID=2133943 RepID=UPI000D3887A1|nr:glycosyltransferase family 9 protein [Glaciimonas sp. PCH181]PUA20275.1 glycosyl transferase [Glaciimonas sp. PCH181]
MALNSAHILICRTDNIGDVILTLPITAYLKQRFPTIKISFLCRAYAAPIVACCGTVDNVIEFESINDPVDFFLKSDIDTVIFAQPEKTLAIAAHKAGIPNRIGNVHRGLFNWLHCNRRIHFTKGRSNNHEAQSNFKYLRPLGIDYIPKIQDIPALYQFDIPTDPSIDRLLAQDRFNLIIHPKSNGHGREWPISHYVTLAQVLSNNPNIALWVTGSLTEGKWISAHAPELFALPNVTDVCGKFTLKQLTSFIQAADGLIASGTGPLHMSAAFGQRTLGLFPGARTMNPMRWGALGIRAQSLAPKKGCAGCKTKNALTCECMKNISPDLVASIVSKWVSEKYAAL